MIRALVAVAVALAVTTAGLRWCREHIAPSSCPLVCIRHTPTPGIPIPSAPAEIDAATALRRSGAQAVEEMYAAAHAPPTLRIGSLPRILPPPKNPG